MAPFFQLLDFLDAILCPCIHGRSPYSQTCHTVSPYKNLALHERTFPLPETDALLSDTDDFAFTSTYTSLILSTALLHTV